MKLSLQHIHLVSQDKKKLAQWYCDHLGFVITDDLEQIGEPGGPILLTADDGVTSISVFTRDRPIQNIFPAFGCEISKFIQLHERFEKPVLYDHFRFFSFYIRDPDHNKIEICITDYQTAKVRFQELGLPTVLMTPETYKP